MKREYQMTEADLEKLLEASRPVPLIGLQCGMPSSPQENANAAWKELGSRMGFDAMTVEPIPGKGNRFFLATPVGLHDQRAKLHLYWPDKPSISFPQADEPSFQLVKAELGTEPTATLQMLLVTHEGKQRYMLVDEDGLRKKLPFNVDASNIAGRPIVGPAAIWTGVWS